MQNMTQISITGKEISYLHICKRKLWLFHHGIRPELEYDNVQIGMLLQDKTFSRQQKEIPVGDVGVLDWADFKDGVIHETKKGRYTAADIAQVRFYLSVLRENGIPVHTAQIHYPQQRKILTLYWDDDCAAKAASDIAAVTQTLSLSVPPPVERKAICKKCAYEEVCFA